MSSEKHISPTLHHKETERGHYGKNAPICYAPEQDPVLASLSESTVSTNTVKIPRGTKTHVKVCGGQGNNEAFLDSVTQVGGLIKHIVYWMAII
jgi:hypothetical protein